MFHGKHADSDPLGRVAVWAGVNLTLEQRVKLDRFATWLREEAIVAGGIGPEEAPRLIDRHIADALVFAAAWTEAPRSVLDVGSGVGLPGIPLAITHPTTSFTLLDRSGRRSGLARRAVRVLGLSNVSVVQEDVEHVAGAWSVVVFRASLPPDRALVAAKPLLDRGGCAVVGLSRRTEPPALPNTAPGTRVELVRTDPGVLDSPAWILRMEQTEPQSKDGNPS
jgi:16S rRNA (guanine527-N7)-methyltransferase